MPDIAASVRDALQAAERQLRKYNRRLNGEINRHEAEFLGQQAETHPEEDWGHLIDGSAQLLCFHRKA